MPTPTGGDTIAERLKSLRAELVRVKATIARAETNGASFNLGGSAGTSVTEIAYDRALRRRRELEREIQTLERRLTGAAAAPGLALTRTVMES